MAACAGNIAGRMGTRRPIMRRVGLMAGQPLGVLLYDGCARLGAEVDHARQRAASRLYVCAARSVTSLALQSTVSERTSRVVRTGMLGVEDAGHGRIAVACQAGIGPLRAVRRSKQWQFSRRCLL